MTQFTVRGKKVFIDGEFNAADILVENGVIVDILPHGSADSNLVKDFDENHIVPGFIDSHVHFDNPGDSITDDFNVGTQNAILGGITTIVDHPFTTPPTTTQEAFEQKIYAAAKRSYTDFGLWGGLSKPELEELNELAGLGAGGMKAFLPDNEMGVVSATRNHLKDGMELLKLSGAAVLVHAEDRELLRKLQQTLTDEGVTRTYSAYGEKRGPEIEIAAVKEVLEVAKETGGRVHIVHLSVPEAIDLVTTAAKEGVKATCEIAAHHLLLDTEDLAEHGWKALCAPPLRSRENVEGLWERLQRDEIITVVSDHCPYNPEDKLASDDDPFNGEFGIQGIREYPSLFLHEALTRGWRLEDALPYLTSRPADFFGLTKGRLEPGMDADFTVLQLGQEETVDVAGQIGDWVWSPYEGKKTSVKIKETHLCGRLVAAGDEIVGTPRGRFISMLAGGPQKVQPEEFKARKPELLAGAKELLTTCLDVTSDDKVLILADIDSLHLARTIRAYGATITETSIEVLPGLNSHYESAFSRIESSVSLNKPTVVVFIASDDGDILSWDSRYWELLDSVNARVAQMTALDIESLASGMGASDYFEVAKFTNNVTKHVTGTKTVKITNALGTDIDFILDHARPWTPFTGLNRLPGQGGRLPQGETFTSPLSASGIIAASVMGYPFNAKTGLLTEPVLFHISDGRLTDVTHSDTELVRELKEWFQKDAGSNRVGELAFGTNKSCKKIIGNLLYDENVPGCHIALGHPFGDYTHADWESSVHVDLVVEKPTILIDGNELMTDGNYTDITE